MAVAVAFSTNGSLMLLTVNPWLFLKFARVFEAARDQEFMTSYKPTDRCTLVKRAEPVR
jgi:hypothetical protein